MGNYKRLLAGALSICMLIGITLPAVPTDAAVLVEQSDTDIPVYSLNNGVISTLYYEDTMDEKTTYDKALGTYKTNGNRMICSDGVLKTDTSTKNAIFNGLKNATSLINYSVLADVSVGSADKFVSVAIYAQEGATTGKNMRAYEFTIGGDATGLYFRLGRRGKGDNAGNTGFTTLKDENNQECKKYLKDIEGFDEYKSGESGAIAMEISAVTNVANNVELTCRAAWNGYTVELKATDSSASKYVSGTAAFRGTDSNATIDNVVVAQKSQDENCLYADNLTVDTFYKQALGSNTTANRNYPYNAEAGALTANNTNVSLFQGITNSGTLSNYTIEADFVYGDATKHSSVIVYGSPTNDKGKADGYHFGFNKGKFKLTRWKSGANTTMAGDDNENLATEWFGDDVFSSGKPIRLSLQAITNADGSVSLVCKATYDGLTKTIFSETEAAGVATTITCGAPGFRGTDMTGTIDNIYVSKYLEPTDTNCLYQDDFTTADSFNVNKNAGTRNYEVANGVLTIPNNTRLTVFDGIEGAETLQNYTIEADFVFGNTTGHNSLVAYGSYATGDDRGAVTGYEFGVVSGNFRLYQNHKTAANSKVLSDSGASNHQVQKYFPNYVNGDVLRLSLTVITNSDGSVSLTAKATHEGVEKVIYQCNDNSEGKITQGAPGLRGTATTSTVDNLYISKITVLGENCGKTDIAYSDVVTDNRYALHGVRYDANRNVFARMELDVAEQIAGTTDYSATSVYTHACESAGGRIRFRTDSSYVAIKATMPSYTEHSRLMAAGKTGFDVYIGDVYYDTIYPIQLPSANNVEWSYNGIVEFDTSVERDITIYFPITQEVSGVKIGVQNTATVVAHSEAYETVEPIVYYGSSITEGGNATRPGLTYVNTVGRMIHRDYIDLGVWGSAHGEEKFAEYIANLNMSMFVFDYDHNAPGPEELAERHEAFYKIVRAAHPDIPIVFISRPNKQLATWEECRSIIYTTYQNALRNDEKVFFIDGQSFFEGEEFCLSDSVHPSDKGHALMANTIGKLLQDIIDGKKPEELEPEEPISISIPYEDTFVEDVDTLKKKWSVDSNVSFENEKAVLNATSMYLTAVDDLAKWHTYVCEADVTMTNVEIKDINVQTAGIVVAANPNSKGTYQGYEVTLLYDETVNKGTGAYYVRIYDRATKANKMQEIDFYQKGEKVTLKVEISDNKINCYVNNKAVITGYTVSGVEKLSGTVGFISSGNQAIVDNLSVKAYAPYSEECKLPFSEQFDNADAIYYRWNHGALLTVSDEKAVLDNNTTRNTYLTGFEEALEWKNYIYEADVILTDTAFADTSIQSAAIVAAANNKNKGYEFGFFMENGSYQVRLYDRIKGKSLAVTEWYYELNEPSKLTMIISGNAIQCYVDGELVIEEWVEGVTELKGTIGMFASGYEAVFDNLKVDTFTGKIVKKEITAPVADANGIYYTDDFETGIYLDDNKWPSTVLDLSKGRAAVSGTKGILYLTGDESYLLLKDYVVEAKTVISAENDFELRDAVGAIVARTTGEKTGYEFGIVCSEDSAYVRLYDRTTGTELAKNSDIPIEVGKEYLLTMVCEGNTITCYVDGVCAFAVKDNTNTSGTAGFRTIGTVYYDDLVVADTSYAIRVVSYSPVTGDNNRNMYMFVIVMIAMATVCVLTLRYKKLKCCNEVGGENL